MKFLIETREDRQVFSKLMAQVWPLSGLFIPDLLRALHDHNKSAINKTLQDMGMVVEESYHTYCTFRTGHWRMHIERLDAAFEIEIESV